MARDLPRPRDGGRHRGRGLGPVRLAAARGPFGDRLYPTAAPATSLRGDPDLAAAAAVLSELPAWLRHSVASVIAPVPDQVTLPLPGAITVLWGGTDRAAAKAAELTMLIRAHMHYYDVSAQGSVLTK